MPREPRQPSRAIDDASAPVLITLIHGTWARHAPFLSPGSQLRTALALHFPAAQFEVFHWTGRNSHEARLTAGADLATLLALRTRQLPTTRHILVAHSHGGNVALYAMRYCRADVAITDIVLMATPLLTFTLRDASATFGTVTIVGTLVAFLASATCFAALAVSHHQRWLAPALLLVITLPYVAAYWGAKAIDKILRDAFLARAQGAIERLSYSPRTGVRIHQWRFSNDEARWALRELTAAADWPFRAFRTVQRTLRLSIPLSLTPAIAISLIMFARAPVISNHSDPWVRPILIILIPLLTYILWEVLLSPALALWSIVQAIGMGPESLACTALVRSTVGETLTEAEDHVLTVEGAREDTLWERAGYWHGRVYNDASVVTAIVSELKR